MNNSKKYELIVKIKELMIETDVNSNDDITNIQKISLNASKVLKLIYDIEEIEPKISNFFTEKINKINYIKSDVKEYEQIVNLRQKQILAQIPQKYIDEYIDSIFFYSENDFLINVFAPYYKTTNYIPLWTNMRIDAYKLYDAINHRPISLFNLIDLILYCDVDMQDLTEMDITDMLYEVIGIPDEMDNELFNLFQDGIDKDQNRIFIKKYYDYYFLSNYENYENYTYSNNFNFNFYLLIAYRKVLFDLLEYIYTMDLSEQEIEKRKQKQEQLRKKQQREQFICKLTDAEKDLFEFIENNLDLSVKEIARRMNKSENTIKKQIRNIMENTNNKKGGLKDLKKLVRLFS